MTETGHLFCVCVCFSQYAFIFMIVCAHFSLSFLSVYLSIYLFLSHTHRLLSLFSVLNCKCTKRGKWAKFYFSINQILFPFYSKPFNDWNPLDKSELQIKNCGVSSLTTKSPNSIPTHIGNYSKEIMTFSWLSALNVIIKVSSTKFLIHSYFQELLALSWHL